MFLSVRVRNMLIERAHFGYTMRVFNFGKEKSARIERH